MDSKDKPKKIPHEPLCTCDVRSREKSDERWRTLKATYLLVGLYRDSEEGICFLSSTAISKIQWQLPAANDAA
eukprot:1179096-Prorocentrum_minimum.AAC.8